MKRMHVGMYVDHIEAAIDFYNRLFDAEPTIRRPDYAKWVLDDPRVNFSIDTHLDGPPGSAHYGIQVESPDELAEMRQRLDEAELPREDQDNLVCGYQRQDKSWVVAPHGVKWETFYTHGVVDAGGPEGYGTDELPEGLVGQ